MPTKTFIMTSAIVAGLTLTTPKMAVAMNIIQDQFHGGYSINHFMPFGQTFTAVGLEINNISLHLGLINNVPSTGDVTLKLYAGEGFSGLLLNTKTVNAGNIVGTTLFAGNWVDFPIPNIPTVQGGIYTIQIIDLSIRFSIEYIRSVPIDAYAGGHAIHSPSRTSINGIDEDLAFKVFSAVPEPKAVYARSSSIPLMDVLEGLCIACPPA